MGNTCGGTSKGDPIYIAEGTGSFSYTDTTLPTSLGPVRFERHYLTASNWDLGGQVGSYAPTPFGTAPGTANGMRWWHSFYTFVAKTNGGWDVFYPGGDLVHFNNCTPGATGCFAPLGTTSKEFTQKLFVTPDGGALTLYNDNDSRYVYGARWNASDGGTPLYFLSRIDAAEYSSGGRAIATLSYATPDAGGCQGSVNGVPYLASITTAEGASLQFGYSAKTAAAGASVSTECVITSLSLVDRNAAAIGVASYSYAGTAGLPTQVALPLRGNAAGAFIQQYSYDGGFFVSEGNGGSYFQTLGLIAGNGAISSEQVLISGVNSNLPITQWSRAPALCAPFSSCAIPFNRAGTYYGNGLGATFGTSYDAGTVQAGFGASHRAQSWTRQDSRSVQYTWALLDGGLAVPTGVKDENGNWSNASVVNSSMSSYGFSTPSEVQTISTGATSGGALGLDNKSYTYTYGGSGQTPRAYEQLVRTESQTSVVDAGTQATTNYIYDGNNRLTAVIKTGLTKKYVSRINWPVSPRSVGTFYFTAATA